MSGAVSKNQYPSHRFLVKVALILCVSVAVVLYGLFGSLFGWKGSGIASVIGFIFCFLSLTIGSYLSWENWQGLSQERPWLGWLRLPLISLIFLFGLVAGTGAVLTFWAGREGVAESPLFQERERYELNNYGTKTEVSRLRFILVGAGFLTAWHGFVVFGLVAQLYFLLFSANTPMRKQDSSSIQISPNHLLNQPPSKRIVRKDDMEAVHLSWSFPPCILPRITFALFLGFWFSVWLPSWINQLQVLRSGGGSFPILNYIWFAGWSLGGPFCIWGIVTVLLPYKPEQIHLTKDQLQYIPGSAADYSQDQWGTKKNQPQHPSLAGLSIQKKLLVASKDEGIVLVLEQVGGRQRLCILHQERKIELGACLNEQEREWLHFVLEQWLRSS